MQVISNKIGRNCLDGLGRSIRVHARAVDRSPGLVQLGHCLGRVHEAVLWATSALLERKTGKIPA